MANSTYGNSTPTFFQPPRHSLSDYLVLVLLSTCIAIGAPMTFMICWKLMQRLQLTGACKCGGPRFGDGRNRGSSRRRIRKTVVRTTSSSSMMGNRRSDLLKLQLNVADLMVLIFYAQSKVIWTLTYKWLGGEILCKLVRFLSVLAFHTCTNSVVCIGLDRMIILLRPSFGNGCQKGCAREYTMVASSCALAFLCSLPQFWIWTVIQVAPNWNQCVGVGLNPAWAEVYSIFHLLTIFWVPCAIIAVSYIVIVVNVLLHLKEPSERRGRHLEHEFIEDRPGVAQTIQASGTKTSIIRRLLQCGRLSRFLCRQTLLILTVYIICWAPYNALTLWIYFRPEDTAIYRSTLRFLQELIVVNSVINPFLYACDVYHQIMGQRSNQKKSLFCGFSKCSCALGDDDIDRV